MCTCCKKHDPRLYLAITGVVIGLNELVLALVYTRHDIGTAIGVYCMLMSISIAFTFIKTKPDWKRSINYFENLIYRKPKVKLDSEEGEAVADDVDNVES